MRWEVTEEQRDRNEGVTHSHTQQQAQMISSVAEPIEVEESRAGLTDFSLQFYQAGKTSKHTDATVT